MSPQFQAAQFQAVIYSVKKPYYHGMELPPGGLAEADIPADVNTRKETLHGVMIGMYGSECRFPQGYDNFQLLEVSTFMPLPEIHEWIQKTATELALPQVPTELSDLCVPEAA